MNSVTALLSYLVIHPQSQSQNLLRKEKEIKSAKYSNCIRQVVVHFGIKTQGLWINADISVWNLIQISVFKLLYETLKHLKHIVS